MTMNILGGTASGSLRIKVLPTMLFETLNSLEILNLQNNKLTHIAEEVTENIVDTLKLIDITDNPLICDCELHWFAVWLDNLRDKDDEIMSKKRTVCTMISEHREYPVQRMPLQKLGCSENKSPERILITSSAKCITYTIYLTTIIALINMC